MVDLSKKSCGCGRWDLTDIPCLHAAATIIDNGEQLKTYVDPAYSKEQFLNCYRWMVKPLPSHEQWPTTSHDPILPPRFTKKVGSPKKVRRRDAGEPINAFRVTKEGTALRCGNCAQWGHNQRTSPAPDNPNKKTYKKKKKGKSGIVSSKRW